MNLSAKYHAVGVDKCDNEGVWKAISYPICTPHHKCFHYPHNYVGAPR